MSTTTDGPHQHSPRQLLLTTDHGDLQPGQLGAVSARHGAGKTAFLVQIALDHLLQGRKVFHVTLDGQDIARVQSWYDILLTDLVNLGVVQLSADQQTALKANRLIQSYDQRDLGSDTLERTLELYAEHLHFCPDVIIIDNHDWSGPAVITAARLGGLRHVAKRLGAQLWFSAHSHRDQPSTHHLGIAPPLDTFEPLLDVVFHLEPRQKCTALHLLKNRSASIRGRQSAVLQSDTTRLLTSENRRSTVSPPPTACTLLSGGATGSEEAFGRLAERWKLAEENFSFEGRPVARERGLIILSDEALQEGNVNERYLQEHMQRTYPDTPLFKKVLQSIWHQVNTAGQVFVVGTLKPDGTVKGGTGWAAELAKHLKKELYLFGQDQGRWFVWDSASWQELDVTPQITSRRFTGTGSRYINDDALRAIQILFEDSFGIPPEDTDDNDVE